MAAWSGEGEPAGWERHPATNRYRFAGDPAREFNPNDGPPAGFRHPWDLGKGWTPLEQPKEERVKIHKVDVPRDGGAVTVTGAARVRPDDRPGQELDVTFELYLEPRALLALVDKAYHNKRRRSRVGPVRLTVTAAAGEA